jgi:putative FmdB family regulatory protein
MPTYDFHCLSCDINFEVELPMGSDLPPCAQCKSENIEKLLSPPPVIFKGSGFYKTDNVKKESKPKDMPKEKTSGSPKNDKEKAPQNSQHKPNTTNEKGVAKHDMTP